MKKTDIHTLRRTIQIGVAAVFALLPLMNAAGFDFLWGNFLNIHVGRLTFSDPLAVLQVIVKNGYLPVGLLTGAGLVLAVAFCLGPVFCSWICPFGLLSERVNRLTRRIRPPGGTGGRHQKTGFKVKAAVFCAGFLFFWGFCSSPVLNRMSLPFQYSNIFQYLLMQHHWSGAIWFFGALLAAEFVSGIRLWCRFICPQSVLLAVAGRRNPLRLKVVFDPKKCVGGKPPGPCGTACSLDLDPRCLTGRIAMQCTNCGDCVDACRKTGGALGFAFRRK